MNAFDLYFGWAPAAHANEVIMVFPQVGDGWNEYTDKNDFHMVFFKKIFDRLTSVVNTQHDYNVPVAKQESVTENGSHDINDRNQDDKAGTGDWV